MTWNNEKEVLLLREILVVEPFKFKAKTKERGQAWQEICDNVNKLNGFTVTSRSVRDKFKVLEDRHKAKMNEERRASGINVEQSEIDTLLEEILLRKTEYEMQKETTLSNEKQLGEDIRNRALETFNETLQRNDQEPKPKKARNTGSDTVVFLCEKMQQEVEWKSSQFTLRRMELENKRKARQQTQEQKEQQYDYSYAKFYEPSAAIFSFPHTKPTDSEPSVLSSRKTG